MLSITFLKTKISRFCASAQNYILFSVMKLDPHNFEKWWSLLTIIDNNNLLYKNHIELFWKEQISNFNDFWQSQHDHVCYILLDRRTLRSSSNTTLLCIPSTNYKHYGNRSFNYQGPKIWNELSCSIRNLTSLNIFKKDYKHTYSIELL